MDSTVKDEHDNGKTSDIFSAGEVKRLKRSSGGFQRLHIEKITPEGKNKTTVSIDDYSYIFLSYQLKQEPFTREANKAIKAWICTKMETDLTYDSFAAYAFSAWLKKIILFEIVNMTLKEKYFSGSLIE